MKRTRFLLLLFCFLIWHNISWAEATTGLSLQISTNGDVPSVSLGCTIGNNYTISLVHRDGDNVAYSFGVLERLYCATGVITFSSFNINTQLVNHIDPVWMPYVRTPLEYIIKDTTTLGSGIPCNGDSCPLINLQGGFNGFDSSVYLASSTYWTTVGAGPIFNTTDNTTWFNSADGDGSVNFTPVSNVMFFPGIEASRLYRGGRPDEGGGEVRLWEPSSDTHVRDLFLDDLGKEIPPLLPEYSVYTRDAVDEAYVSLLGPNIYKSFLSDLEEMKSTSHTIVDYSAIAYDWRFSLDDILQSGTKTGSNISYTQHTGTPYIISELERLASSSPTGKVSLVAHSNGGLLVKALMSKLAVDGNPLLQKVDKVILVAVPQLGTPTAIAVMMHGYNHGILNWAPFPFISEYTAREFSHNLPGAYNLLPSENYFTYVDNPVVTFDTATLSAWSDVYGETIHSKTRQHDFLVGSFGRVLTGSENTRVPVQLSDTLLSQAETVHSVLDNWSPPSGVSVFQIAGWGVPSTISGVNYITTRCFRIWCGFLSRNISPSPTWTIDGDGTVVTPSALWMNSVGSGRYWVDLKRYNTDSSISTGFGLFPFNHKNILEVQQLRLLIKNILISQSTLVLPQYISSTAPVADPNDSRLLYTLRSPLSMDVYDGVGNHTGISTSTGKLEQNIPDTVFVTLGDSQYVFVNSSTTSNIVVSSNSKNRNGPIFGGGGEDIPFTLTLEQFNGNNLTASTTFSEITANPNTTAIVTVSGGIISGTSPLAVNTDSTGSPEYTIVPIINDVVTMPIPVVVSISSPVVVVSINTSTSNPSNGPIVQGGFISTPTISTSSRAVVAGSDFTRPASTSELTVFANNQIVVSTEPAKVVTNETRRDIVAPNSLTVFTKQSPIATRLGFVSPTDTFDQQANARTAVGSSFAYLLLSILKFVFFIGILFIIIFL